jgi:hypothetical protein
VVAERRLLARLEAGEPELAILASDRAWETLYHLAPHRRNLLEWYPFPPSGRVLERWAEGGALTGLLLERSGRVVAVQHDPVHAALLARRHGARTALEIRSALPDPSERFETIVAVVSGLGGAPDLPDLADLAPRLTSGGRLVVGLPGLVTPALEAAFRSAGLTSLERLHPVPDLWLPSELFSGSFGPGRGSFPVPFPRYDAPVVRSAPDHARLRAIAAAGAFASVAPATLVVAGRA